MTHAQLKAPCLKALTALPPHASSITALPSSYLVPVTAQIVAIAHSAASTLEHREMAPDELEDGVRLCAIQLNLCMAIKIEVGK